VARKRSIVRTIGRYIALFCALGFAYLAYIYLTLPDVRPLAKTNPTTTAFMELRKAEARENRRRNFAIRQHAEARGDCH
jgi:monofunctional glycosyltransferase